MRSDGWVEIADILRADDVPCTLEGWDPYGGAWQEVRVRYPDGHCEPATRDETREADKAA